MYVVSWQDADGHHQKGHEDARDARAHETYLRRLGLRSVVVWELEPEDAA